MSIKCQMCIIGASISDINRIQMIHPDKIDILFLFFKTNGFTLTINYIDPHHEHSKHEFLYKHHYNKSRHDIRIYEQLFATYIINNPIKNDYLIVMDFTGCNTPSEIIIKYHIKKPNSKLSNSSHILLLPMGCGCGNFDYTTFLYPLIKYQEFTGLWLDEFSLIRDCIEITSRITDQQDIYLEALSGVEEYSNTSIYFLNPYIEIISSSWEMGFTENIIRDYYYKINNHYSVHPSQENERSLHMRYIKKTYKSLQTQILLEFLFYRGYNNIDKSKLGTYQMYTI